MEVGGWRLEGSPSSVEVGAWRLQGSSGDACVCRCDIVDDGKSMLPWPEDICEADNTFGYARWLDNQDFAVVQRL